MKKLLLLVIFGLLVTSQVSAQTNTEQVQVLDAKFVINQDASVSVTENIVYNFGTTQHHGIFRDIPYKYSRNGGNYTLNFRDVSVTDFTENPYPFTTSKTGGNFEIKIGDPGIYVTGIQNYRIRYTVSGAINYFSDHDEFYWNVVGSGWTVPFGGASADVKLPPGTVTSDAQATCFSGNTGSTEKCLNINTYGDSYAFSSRQILPGENFTVVISMPKGAVHQPTRREIILKFIRDNIILGLPLLTLAVMWWMWAKYGRDPKSKLPVVAQYEAPDGLTPVEIGYLADDRVDSSDISAEIIYMATKGHLNIERVPKKGIFGHEDFKLIKLKPVDDLHTEFDKNLFMRIFPEGMQERLLSSLKKSAQTASKKSGKFFERELIPDKLTKAGYYTGNPRKIRVAYGLGGGVLGVIAFSVFGQLGSVAVISVIASFIVFVAFAYFMPKKTVKGSDTKQLILGLKEYLSVAEKDRLDFHNDAAKDPKIFEKLLPYAMALGVSEAWAKKFEGLFEYHPTWYSDPGHAYFNFLVFNAAMNDFGRGVQSAAAASAAGAGRGASGFGGGGFSGGGFGGGGGGSW